MLATTHIESVPAEVHQRPANRCVARSVDNGAVVVLAAGLGLPRLWGLAARAVVDGFIDAYEASSAKGKARIDAATNAARSRLSFVCDQLIERMTPDASLTAVLLLGDELHVINAGTGRVYVHRAGQPKRLTNRDEPALGLLRAAPVHATELLLPGDLIIAGTEAAFSAQAISKLAATLEASPQVAPNAVANLLLAPIREQGIGAAAAALRVH